MNTELWESIFVADAKQETMKCTYYLFEQAGRRYPSIFNLKNYPREYRKRSNKVFDYLHQMVKRQLDASIRKRKALAGGAQQMNNGASVRYSDSESDDLKEVSNAPNAL